MNSSKLYIIISKLIILICFFCMSMVGVRVFSRVILIELLSVDNNLVSYLANYSWGSYLLDSGYESGEKPDDNNKIYNELETIYFNVNEANEKQIKNKIENSAQKMEEVSTLKLQIEDVDKLKNELDSFCNTKFIFYQPMRELMLNYRRCIGWDCAYAREDDSIYTLKDGNEYTAQNVFDISDDAKKIIGQKDIAKSLGTEFVYIQIPFRIDENEEKIPWGVNSYQNFNANAKIEVLQDAGVNVIDLRQLMPKKDWNYEDAFYQTDGHWNMKSGFIAAGCIAEYLNENHSWNYEKYYFDTDNYETRIYGVNNPDVEEKIEILIPNFDTNIQTVNVSKGLITEGPFEESCLDMHFLDTQRYSTVSTAYYASRLRNSAFFEYINKQNVNNNKRILICSHSMSWYLIPYLALDTAYVDFIYLSESEKMEHYIRELKPDIVMMMDW